MEMLCDVVAQMGCAFGGVRSWGIGGAGVRSEDGGGCVMCGTSGRYANEVSGAYMHEAVCDRAGRDCMAACRWESSPLPVRGRRTVRGGAGVRGSEELDMLGLGGPRGYPLLLTYYRHLALFLTIGRRCDDAGVVCSKLERIEHFEAEIGLLSKSFVAETSATISTKRSASLKCLWSEK